MAKPSSDDIQINDIKEFIETESDFSFELRVLDKLQALSFNCEHNGTYEDPVSKKVREFDILAKIKSGDFNIALSIECKNLKKNFPLVVHCTQRTGIEAYNEIITIRSKDSSSMANLNFISTPAEVIRLTPGYSIYKTNFLVGRTTDQIFRDHSSKSLCSNDSGVFEKISQAVNSSYKLIQEANRERSQQKIFICPILVVPDETLWAVSYDSTELHSFQIDSAKHISYYIGKEWETPEMVPAQRIKYTLSHLELVTESHLKEVVTNFLGFEKVFKVYRY